MAWLSRGRAFAAGLLVLFANLGNGSAAEVRRSVSLDEAAALLIQSGKLAEAKVEPLAAFGRRCAHVGGMGALFELEPLGQSDLSARPSMGLFGDRDTQRCLVVL